MSPRPEITVTIDVDTSKFKAAMREIRRDMRRSLWVRRFTWWALGFNTAMWPVAAIVWWTHR